LLPSLLAFVPFYIISISLTLFGLNIVGLHAIYIVLAFSTIDIGLCAIRSIVHDCTVYIISLTSGSIVLVIILSILAY